MRSAGPFSGNSRHTVTTTGTSSAMPSSRGRSSRPPRAATPRRRSRSARRGRVRPCAAATASGRRTTTRRSARRRGRATSAASGPSTSGCTSTWTWTMLAPGEPGEDGGSERVARPVAGVDDPDAAAAHEQDEPDEATTAGSVATQAAHLARPSARPAPGRGRRERGRCRGCPGGPRRSAWASRPDAEAAKTSWEERSRWRMIWACTHVSAPSGGSVAVWMQRTLVRAGRPWAIPPADCIAAMSRV